MPEFNWSTLHLKLEDGTATLEWMCERFFSLVVDYPTLKNLLSSENPRQKHRLPWHVTLFAGRPMFIRDRRILAHNAQMIQSVIQSSPRQRDSCDRHAPEDSVT